MIGWPLVGGLVALAFASSLLGTWLLRGYALRRDLLDRPNDRSSHQAPTPRGGGLAIVVGFLAALAALAASGSVPAAAAIGIGGGGLIVALIGFRDDYGHVAARWRLLAHFAAAAWLLAWFGGVPDLFSLGDSPAAQALLTAGAAVGIVWLVNLYNFMDGIDGIASVEAITATVGAAAAAIATGASEAAPLPLLLAGAAAGFLVWNWPPARIFMGDVGSGFLGLVLAGLALAGAHAHPPLFYAWAILLASFVVDATVTLVRRGLRGEPVYEAHRSHAYQNASRHYRGHTPVTLAVALINLLWLAPIAVAAALEWLAGPVAVAAAYGPLLLLALYWNAGGVEAPAKRD